MALLLLCLGWPAAAQVVTAEETDDGTRILIDGELYCELLTDAATRYGESPRPFIYPIIGPTGAEMTRGYPMRDYIEDEARDHPHHRSLWFAHFVNGVDFWTQGEGRGVIRVTELARVAIPLERQTVATRTEWLAPDGSLLATSNGAWEFEVLDDGSRVIDFDIAITPAEGVEQLTFQDTKEGTMAIRTHPALRLVGEHATGHAVNSEGDTDRELWGKRAEWVAYWGTIDGEVCGVAIFDHPENLRHPTWWHARDYGLIAANPFGIHDFEGAEPGTGDYTLEWGETLTLRYRFVFFAGDAGEADIAGKYEQWVAETMANDDQQPDHEAE